MAIAEMPVNRTKKMRGLKLMSASGDRYDLGTRARAPDHGLNDSKRFRLARPAFAIAADAGRCNQ